MSHITESEYFNGFECIKYEKKDHVAYITLNRPSVLNALNNKMHEELLQVWDDFEQDDHLYAGVLSGAGDRAFSVGQDLKELVQDYCQGKKPASFGSRGRPGYPRLTERFAMSKPLIAKVSGYALGGGFELALACDIIIASDRSLFSLPEAKHGLIQGAGGLFRLVRQIPFKIALGYLLTGRRMSADRAYQLGLVNEVVPEKDLDDCVMTWLEEILQCSPLSLKAIKQVAYQSVDMTLSDAFNAKYECEENRLKGCDCLEGPRAFLEKRKPNWS